MRKSLSVVLYEVVGGRIAILVKILDIEAVSGFS